MGCVDGWDEGGTRSPHCVWAHRCDWGFLKGPSWNWIPVWLDYRLEWEQFWSPNSDLTSASMPGGRVCWGRTEMLAVFSLSLYPFLRLFFRHLNMGRFFKGTDSDHAVMPVCCNVEGTAVSPPLMCSSGVFYKQMNYEWVSVVKKIQRKTWHWASRYSWHPEVIWKLMEDYFPLNSHRHLNLGAASYCNVLHESMCRMFLKEEISFWLCKK